MNKRHLRFELEDNLMIGLMRVINRNVSNFRGLVIKEPYFAYSFVTEKIKEGPVSVDIRVNRISAISGHMHRLEGRRMRRGASGTPACACLPNDAYAQRWRLIRQTLIYLQPLLFSST